jgi:hypothetical protein
MVAFSNVENTIQKAKEYIWILSDQILVSTLPHLQEALKRGDEFKLILSAAVEPPKTLLNECMTQSSCELWKKGNSRTGWIK